MCGGGGVFFSFWCDEHVHVLTKLINHNFNITLFQKNLLFFMSICCIKKRKKEKRKAETKKKQSTTTTTKTLA